MNRLLKRIRKAIFNDILAKLDYMKGDNVYGGYYWSDQLDQRLKDEKCLERYGYKVYSQNDEDGIIAEIFRRIGTTNKTFVEFGVQNGLESNCHNLILKDWTGLWIEGDARYYKAAAANFSYPIEKGRLKLLNAFVTAESINRLISGAGITGEIDLLSIDIDGNDYHVFKAITTINPRSVVIEYNAKMDPETEWVIPYNPNQVWDKSDNQGASLKSLEILGRARGYQLVGTNSNGVNAFFVRQDLAGNKFASPATAEKLYNPARLNVSHRTGHGTRRCLYNK